MNEENELDLREKVPTEEVAELPSMETATLPQENIDEIVEIKVRNPKKTGTITLRTYKDRNNQLIKVVNSRGEERVVKLTSKKKLLNLANEDDKIEYEAWKRHPIYFDCPHPVINIKNKTEEAKKSIDVFNLQYEAMELIKDLTGQDLADFARVLGVQSDNVKETVVKGNVINIVQTDPQRVIDEWNDPHREFKTILHRGKKKGIFSETRDGIWQYRNNVMGTSILHAIQWLIDNDDLMPSIRKEINTI